MLKQKVVLGVDVGGTNVKMALVSKTGKIIDRAQFAVGEKRSAVEIVRRIVDCAKLLSERTSLKFSAAGCGIPGIVDFEKGIVCRSPHFPEWKNGKFREMLHRSLRVPVAIDNDANMFAIGESLLGAAKRSDNMVFLTLGTGIGAGIILDHKLLRGDRGFAGEVGHITLNADGPKCECGSNGCFELYAASRAFEINFSKLTKGEQKNILSLANVSSAKHLTPEMVADLAAKKNAAAIRLWNEFGKYFGIGLAALTNVLGVTCFVVGGGISESLGFFKKAAIKEYANRTYPENARALTIQKANLGQNGGLIGSAVEAFSLLA